MKVTHPAVNFQDARGEIKDVLVRQRIDFVTLVNSKKGAVRGHHYHKLTTQYNYLLQGKVKFLSQMGDEPVRATILEPGDLGVTPPMEKHTMISLEDSVLLVLTNGVRGGDDYELDTYRLAEPLKDPGNSP